MIEKLDIFDVKCMYDKLNEVIEAVNKQEALVTARWEIINETAGPLNEDAQIHRCTFGPTDTEMLDFIAKYSPRIYSCEVTEHASIEFYDHGKFKDFTGKSLRDVVRKAMEEDNDNSLA